MPDSPCELQASRIMPDMVWKKEARSRKEATHLPNGAGYKWVYTARRGAHLREAKSVKTRK